MVRRKGYIFVLSTTLILCFIVMIFTAVSQSSVMTNTTECKKNSDCEWKSYEEFMNNFTTDDTEDFYKYAREHKAILRIEHMGNIPKEGDGNKKYEIEITYSFDDGIESMGYFNTPEEAYERMCQVAATEAYVQGSEFLPEQDCIVYFHPSEKRIALHYLSDDEWCYYDLKELED